MYRTALLLTATLEKVTKIAITLKPSHKTIKPLLYNFISNYLYPEIKNKKIIKKNKRENTPGLQVFLSNILLKIIFTTTFLNFV